MPIPKHSYARYFQGKRAVKNLSTDDLRNFEFWPKFLLSQERNACTVLSKETAKRSRTTSQSCQGKQILKYRHAKNRFY